MIASSRLFVIVGLIASGAAAFRPETDLSVSLEAQFGTSSPEGCIK
jgi:hypothetical protein